MAELVKPWNDGGSLTATYEGSGDGSAVFSSDVAEGLDREMSVAFVDASRQVNVARTVKQIGKREPFVASDGDFVLADGGTFNVLKEEFAEKIEYTELDSIVAESAGPWIDTGVNCTSNIRVVFDCLVYDSSSATYVLGTPTRKSGALFLVRITTSGTSLVSDYGSSSGKNSGVQAGVRRVIDKNKNTMTVDGVTVTHPEQTFDCESNLGLLTGTSTSGSQGLSRGTIYGAQVYDNDILVRDFIPVQWKDGRVGLYDKVNKQFYSSAGKKEFIAGEIIEE